MTDLLNLPYWNVLKVQETDLNYVIDATYEVEPAGCPHCGFMIRYGHGTKEKLFMDTPIHGKRVGIRAIRNRYKCQNCGKTYIQPLPDMNEDHFMTKRLVSYIEREVFKRTFTAMAAEIGGFAYGYDEIAYGYTFGFIAGALITNLGNNFDGDNQ